MNEHQKEAADIQWLKSVDRREVARSKTLEF